ncbi:MAG: UDP-N-acetylmuramoyl-L-alanine--D-glutamate ligase [Patescibacteria group bacterium]
MSPKAHNEPSTRAVTFEFISYNFDPLKKRVIFNYKTEFLGREPLFFTEAIILPKIPDTSLLPSGLLKKFLEGLHIILGISYYKLYCPPAAVLAREGAAKVKLPYNLSKNEADFWNKVYKNGLGEFFYKNNLDPKISPRFSYQKNVRNSKFEIPNSKLRCLVGIGGGKDSIITAELLKKNNFEFSTFFVQTGIRSNLIDKIAKLLNKRNLTVVRILDPKVFKQHRYSGHIPISAIYAFLGLFSAVLYGYSYFIVGNEYSSNFGNLKYKGLEINHQWSKSFDFERLFQDYIKSFISPDLFYFSLLRPFYEIRIVKMFSKLEKYFPYFSSCNRNLVTAELRRNSRGTTRKLWCCQCAKCVFVFTLLSAFLKKKDLIKIFKKNLYQDKNLLPLFKDILGKGKSKPFDCVGTFQESQTAICLAKNSFKDDFIIKELSKRVHPVKYREVVTSPRAKLFNRVKLYPEVLKAQKESSVPEQFKFLGMQSALILGYGNEGKITEKYLKKYYPEMKIGIADKKQGKNYLKNIGDYDIVIKTPGIPKEGLPAKTTAPKIGAVPATNFTALVPYTTATNIFFSKVKDKNLIIGITGSKGKSTTSALIYEIIKKSGRRVELLGNIGKPMLERLLRPVNKKVIFVLELSSYQLDDIKFSPGIAVLTGLFEEHMDYHGSVSKYFKAKKNIINFQNRNEVFIYNQKSKESKKWLKNYKGRAIPFDDTIKFETELLGEHNRENIKAAISVAKVLGITKKVITKVVKDFRGLPHRLEFIGEYKGIKFYDDAISTIPESTIMAIKSIKSIDTILLGGEDRGYDFSGLEKTIKKYKIRNIVLFPNSGRRILKNRVNFNVLETSKMEKAVKFAYKNTKKGNVCLLSCASPSYSLWKNFEEKGNQFKYYVKKFSK